MVSHVRDGTNHLNDFRKAWFPTTIISTSVKKVRIWVLNRVIFFGLTTFKLFSYVLRMRLLKCYLSAHTFQNLNSSSPALLLICKCNNVLLNLEKCPFFEYVSTYYPRRPQIFTQVDRREKNKEALVWYCYNAAAYFVLLWSYLSTPHFWSKTWNSKKSLVKIKLFPSFFKMMHSSCAHYNCPYFVAICAIT